MHAVHDNDVCWVNSRIDLSVGMSGIYLRVECGTYCVSQVPAIEMIPLGESEAWHEALRVCGSEDGGGEEGMKHKKEL